MATLHEKTATYSSSVMENRKHGSHRPENGPEWVHPSRRAHMQVPPLLLLCMNERPLSRILSRSYDHPLIEVIRVVTLRPPDPSHSVPSMLLQEDLLRSI